MPKGRAQQWRAVPNDGGYNPAAEGRTQRRKAEPNGEGQNPTAKGMAQQWRVEPNGGGHSPDVTLEWRRQEGGGEDEEVERTAMGWRRV